MFMIGCSNDDSIKGLIQNPLTTLKSRQNTTGATFCRAANNLVRGLYHNFNNNLKTGLLRYEKTFYKSTLYKLSFNQALLTLS